MGTPTSQKTWRSLCAENDPEWEKEQADQPAYEWYNGTVHKAKRNDAVVPD